MHPILPTVDHRPWPLPQGPWIMTQTWNDLLFAHWPLPPEVLRQRVPAALDLDTFDGQGWIAVTPFHMTGVRPRGVPDIPGFSKFPELNVRTYVTCQGRAGVYFFSLDAASLSAVLGARSFYRLPYFYSNMKVQVNEDVHYDCNRRVSPQARFRARYRPVSAVRIREKGTLENWLTERYCLYTASGEQVFRADIHHVPWPLQDAEADIEVNTMARAAGFTLPDVAPLLHFSRQLQVLVWPLRRVRSGAVS